MKFFIYSYYMLITNQFISKWISTVNPMNKFIFPISYQIVLLLKFYLKEWIYICSIITWKWINAWKPYQIEFFTYFLTHYNNHKRYFLFWENWFPGNLQAFNVVKYEGKKKLLKPIFLAKNINEIFLKN